MNNPVARIALAVIFCAGLGGALHWDVRTLAVQQGNESLNQGDLNAAEKFYDRAARLGDNEAVLHYNLGVVLYRRGAYAQARARFDRALPGAGPALAVAVAYNRGNTFYREAERLAAQQPQAAQNLLKSAMAEYGRALALAPDSADAQANLSLTEARLAALGRAREPAADGRGARRDTPQPDPGVSARAVTGREQDTGLSSPQKMQGVAQAGRAGAPAAADHDAGTGKPRTTLSRSDAERMLNEARGRDRHAGPFFPNPAAARQEKPERDW